MTTTDLGSFDARLARRLAALEAAVPASRPALRIAARPAPARSRRRRLPVLLAAAALLVVAGGVAAERTLYPDSPEPRLEAALAAISNAAGCQSAAVVKPRVEAKLSELGYADWVVTPRPGADTASCVFPGVVSPLHEVALFPGAGQQLADALDGVRQALEDGCLNRSQAFALVRSVVESVGTERDFTVSADPWGPTGGPVDKIDVYRQHVAAGCFVYVGLGRDDSGRANFYLWGPWP